MNADVCISRIYWFLPIALRRVSNVKSAHIKVHKLENEDSLYFLIILKLTIYNIRIGQYLGRQTRKWVSVNGCQ